MDGIFNWAEDEARTRDLNLGKVALYQLSYFRIYYSEELFWKDNVSPSGDEPTIRPDYLLLLNPTAD